MVLTFSSAVVVAVVNVAAVVDVHVSIVVTGGGFVMHEITMNTFL